MIQTKKSILMIISATFAVVFAIIYLVFIGACYFVIKKLPSNPISVSIFVIIIICIPALLAVSIFYILCAKTYFTFAMGKKNNNVIISRTKAYSIINLYFLVPSLFMIFVNIDQFILMSIIILSKITLMFVFPQIEIEKRKKELKQQLFNF